VIAFDRPRHPDRGILLLAHFLDSDESDGAAAVTLESNGQKTSTLAYGAIPRSRPASLPTRFSISRRRTPEPTWRMPRAAAVPVALPVQAMTLPTGTVTFLTDID
jgi:hypothetical protein